MKKIILAITCASIISSVNSFGVANAHYHDCNPDRVAAGQNESVH